MTITPKDRAAALEHIAARATESAEMDAVARELAERDPYDYREVLAEDQTTAEAFDNVTAVTDLSPPDRPSDQGERRNGDRSDRGDTGQRRTVWTAAELMATSFPDPKWAVPGIVAEGLNLVAGAPKCGKSWLGLGLGVAVASGGKALGRIDVDQGPALVLALEDTPRRLKSRLAKILGDDRAPTGLTIAVECPPLPMGGDEKIAGWLDRNPDARLVVIDVFAKVRGPVFRDASAYDNDYAAVGRAKALADEFGVAVVLIHHTRKASDDDWLATISGTHGIAGASDAIAVLQRTRGKADGLLSVTGRDIDEAEYALTFAADLGAWQLSEIPAAVAKLTDTRAAIVGYLAQVEDGAGPKRIADSTGIGVDLVKQTVRRMVEDGQLDTNGHGRYWATTPVTSVTPVTIPGQGADDPVTAVSPVSPDLTGELLTLASDDGTG